MQTSLVRQAWTKCYKAICSIKTAGTSAEINVLTPWMFLSQQTVPEAHDGTVQSATTLVMRAMERMRALRENCIIEELDVSAMGWVVVESAQNVVGLMYQSCHGCYQGAGGSCA